MSYCLDDPLYSFRCGKCGNLMFQLCREFLISQCHEAHAERRAHCHVCGFANVWDLNEALVCNCTQIVAKEDLLCEEL